MLRFWEVTFPSCPWRLRDNVKQIPAAPHSRTLFVISSHVSVCAAPFFSVELFSCKLQIQSHPHPDKDMTVLASSRSQSLSFSGFFLSSFSPPHLPSHSSSSGSVIKSPQKRIIKRAPCFAHFFSSFTFFKVKSREAPNTAARTRSP